MSTTKTARKPSAPASKPAAPTPPTPTGEAARKIALYGAPGFLDVNRARAALWLLEQIDGDHLVFRHADDQITPDDLQDWCRGIAKDAIREALDEATVQIEEAARKAGQAAGA